MVERIISLSGELGEQGMSKEGVMCLLEAYLRNFVFPSHY